MVHFVLNHVFASKFEVSKENLQFAVSKYIYTTQIHDRNTVQEWKIPIYNLHTRHFLLESIDSLMIPLSNLLLLIVMKPTFSNFVQSETKIILEYLILTFLSFLNTLVQTKLDVGNMSVRYHLSI
jgi:hypothetical protein